MNLLAAVENYRIGIVAYVIIGIILFTVLGLIIKQKFIRTVFFVLAGAFAVLLACKAFNIIPPKAWKELQLYFLLNFGILI